MCDLSDLSDLSDLLNLHIKNNVHIGGTYYVQFNQQKNY